MSESPVAPLLGVEESAGTRKPGHGEREAGGPKTGAEAVGAGRSGLGWVLPGLRRQPDQRTMRAL